MAPKGAANQPAIPARLDFPWALSTLQNPEDPQLLAPAFNYLLGLNPSQIPQPQDVDVGVQLITATVSYVTFNGDSQLSSAAMKLLGKVYHDARGAMADAVHHPTSLQALWGVLSYHHTVHPEYVAALAALAAEPSSDAPLTARSKAGDARGKKDAQQQPVDPESTLPGPSKFALDAAIDALGAVAACGNPAAEAELGRLAARDVAPLLTLLKHNSCRIQPPAHDAADKDEEAAPPEPPPPPPPPQLDMSHPVASSPDRIQDLTVALLLQLARQHHGAAQELLRLGALKLLAALLPAPELPELPQPEHPVRRPSSSDTIFASFIPGLGARRPSESTVVVPTTPKDAWLQYLDCEPPLPLPVSRAASHRLQASLLTLLSCLLAEPGAADYWWHVHASARPHLQLMFLLATEEVQPPLAAVISQAQMAHLSIPANKRTSKQGKPDPTLPPFPPEVRGAALGCVLQLTKHASWLALAPHLRALQATLRDPVSWGVEMAAPLAEIIQRIMTAERQSKGGSGGAGGKAPPPAAPPAPPPLAAEGSGGALAAAASPRASPRTAAAPSPPPLPPPPATPNGLSLEDNGLAEVTMSTSELVEALKALAQLARKGSDPWATSAVAAALLALPEGALYAPPWPPLPSPPPTPPPPPLPTSQYLWDALGRPVMTDGIQLVHL
ncbi:hypothetical protein GPECTOR_23g37 [Gonium pectorale]|uniref:Uncharacterized protein n=1 Tax=Gonium pectorale TaxID=33097 RepID=A0A150GGZ5_GONPE|nr:hypothetical protein GPECTOR_23g37 [Gonium pectorale]|eukprot:KXZ49106.1 hypothetical protein GPECTOR_23g37 [Gonium pectorale]